MVLPGQYEVRLTVDGETLRRPIQVKLDPRLSYSNAELKRQLDLAQRIASAMGVTYAVYNQAAQLQKELAGLPQTEATKEIDGKLRGLTDAAGPPEGFGPLNRDLTRMLIAIDQSDSPPAAEVVEAYSGMCQEVQAALSRWNEIRTTDLPKLTIDRKPASPPAPPRLDCGN
jgi:hypothetical protein